MAVMPGLPALGIPPGGKGEAQMADNGDRSFYKWILLIAKLLGAFASFLAVLAEFFR